PLAISDSVLERIGTDSTLDEPELGRDPNSIDRDFYGLWYQEKSNDYQLKVAFPLWMERTQPSLIDPSKPDRASVFGGVYYNRRSAEHSDDILFPLFWNLRDKESRTTVVGPLVNRVAPQETDNWLAPLYFLGTRENGGSYQIIPPLLTYLNNDNDGGFNLIGPGYCSWEKGGGCFSSPVNRDYGLFPLYFAGKTADTNYRLIPPLLHYHERDLELETQLDVWGPFYRETQQKHELF